MAYMWLAGSAGQYFQKLLAFVQSEPAELDSKRRDELRAIALEGVRYHESLATRKAARLAKAEAADRARKSR